MIPWVENPFFIQRKKIGNDDQYLVVMEQMFYLLYGFTLRGDCTGYFNEH